jgi:hypothetical protein
MKMTNTTTFGKEMICCKCGLPQSICVCEEIKKEAKRKVSKTMKQEKKDDFIFCHTCGCYHYKDAHIKNKMKEE